LKLSRRYKKIQARSTTSAS